MFVESFQVKYSSSNENSCLIAGLARAFQNRRMLLIQEAKGIYLLRPFLTSFFNANLLWLVLPAVKVQVQVNRHRSQYFAGSRRHLIFLQPRPSSNCGSSHNLKPWGGLDSGWGLATVIGPVTRAPHTTGDPDWENLGTRRVAVVLYLVFSLPDLHPGACSYLYCPTALQILIS